MNYYLFLLFVLVYKKQFPTFIKYKYSFLFYNEIKMLLFRLEELYDYVDYFVINYLDLYM